jgi:site-specific recombinase XerD
LIEFVFGDGISCCGRRTYATNIASQGVGLRVLMRLMGHRNPSVTAVYIDDNHESPRILRRLHTLRRWSHEQEIKPFFT